ncbi:MAG TPA: hypothetical protein VL442_15865 [Mucilaginibacter sp.]|jgi:hypothetical protein|nr:hypothetical protein [Mucilaginibacter sp.]
MKDMNELNDRMDATDEILENLIKKTTELEKQTNGLTGLNIPDYTESLANIMKVLNEIKAGEDKDRQLNLLNGINAKLDRELKPTGRQIRILLFPETNQGQYYKIVFGRLIPWGLAFVIATYIFITGYKAIEIYRHNEDVSQSMHYEHAWLYLQQHSKKKVLRVMDEAKKKQKEKDVEIWKTLWSLPHSHISSNNNFFN